MVVAEVETSMVVAEVEAVHCSSWEAVVRGPCGASHTGTEARRGLLDRAAPPSAQDGCGTYSQLAANASTYAL